MNTQNAQPKKSVQRRVLSGIVVSDKNAQTIVVAVERTIKHPLYGKQYNRTRKFHVHDSKGQFHVGDVVDFVQCRPISKLKRWRVIYKNESEQAV